MILERSGVHRWGRIGNMELQIAFESHHRSKVYVSIIHNTNHSFFASDLLGNCNMRVREGR